MVTIRPKWTKLYGSDVEANDQQTSCTTHAYAVQLRMSHGIRPQRRNLQTYMPQLWRQSSILT